MLVNFLPGLESHRCQCGSCPIARRWTNFSGMKSARFARGQNHRRAQSSHRFALRNSLRRVGTSVGIPARSRHLDCATSTISIVPGCTLQNRGRVPKLRAAKYRGLNDPGPRLQVGGTRRGESWCSKQDSAAAEERRHGSAVAGTLTARGRPLPEAGREDRGRARDHAVAARRAPPAGRIGRRRISGPVRCRDSLSDSVSYPSDDICRLLVTVEGLVR